MNFQWPPPTITPCRHMHPEWFRLSFDCDHPDTQYFFKSARNISEGDDWNNPLAAMCHGARDSFDLPQGRSYQEPLYKLLEERPEIYFCHHNPASGAFYIRFGCANCNSMTGYYFPQYEDALLDKCPPNVEGKYLKQVDEVRTAFREYIGQVLAGTSPLRDAATGTLRMSQESQCKHWRNEPMQHDGEAVRCRGTSVKTSSESSQVAPMMMEFSSAITVLCIVYSAILHGNVSRVIDSHLLHEPVTFALTDFSSSCRELEPHTIEPLVWIKVGVIVDFDECCVDRTWRQKSGPGRDVNKPGALINKPRARRSRFSD